jgi:CBS domain-containing protein
VSWLVAGCLPGSRGLKVSSLGIGMAHDQPRTSFWEGPMRISDVLRVKGTQVVTVTPDTTVRQLLAVLAEHKVGAVVVSRNGTVVDGIASERDIVRALARRGAAVMSDPVTAIYTAEVHTVTPQTPIEEVMRMMTERRVRHVPVVVDGSLHGIVSIGDVVKIRIGELETERTALTDYITGTR